MEVPKAGVELKSIAGMYDTVEFALGAQMRTPGFSGAMQLAEAILKRQETVSNVDNPYDKVRINKAPFGAGL